MPTHWQVARAKVFLREVDERSVSGAEELLSVSHKTGVTPRREKNVTMFMAESNAGDKLCQPGDLVINTMWAWMAAMGVSKHRGIVSPSYGVYRPLSPDLFDPAYLDWLVRTHGYHAEYNVRSSGITASRLRLYPDAFLRIPLLRPPLDEQVAIVRFLSHADQRIKQAIKTRKRFVSLLEEQKRALIHRAVTRGLDDSVELKASGLEWAGLVPTHWDVVALRYRYSQSLGKMLDAKRITGSHLVPYLRNADVQWDCINTRDLPAMDIRPEEQERFILKPGDLLVCEGGEVGRAAIWNGELEVCAYQKALHRLRPQRVDLDVPRYLFYLLTAACYRDAFFDGHVSTIPHLTGEKLRAHRLPFPPFHEQNRIVATLDEVSTNFDQKSALVNREIELIQEYRTRLIADVVTGQFDVREAAALLDDLGELEDFDSDEADDVEDGDPLALDG